RHRGRRRRAHERAPAPRRLPWRQPLHDLGVQGRAPRGGGQAEKEGLAGARGSARAGRLGPLFQRRPRAGRRSRTERAAVDAPERDRGSTDPAPAARARGSRPERRPDRRPRRTAEHEPWRALQDLARRTAEASQASTRARARARRLAGGETMMERPDLKQALGRLLGPAGPEVGCDACFAELDRYVELELAGKDADVAIPGLRAHLDG